MLEKRAGYKPVYDTGLKDDSYKNFQCILIDDEDKFNRLLTLWDKSDKTLVGFDTETNSCLDPEKLKMVGCSIAFNKEYGFYLPFYHTVGQVLPLDCFTKLERILHEAGTVLYYNTRFDLRVQRKYGHDISKINDFDISLAVWNWDTNVKMPSLKKVAIKYLLGWDLESFEERFGKIQNLAMYFPEEVVEYAVYDSISLLHLYEKCTPIIKEAHLPISLDNMLTRTIMKIEDTPHPLDIDTAVALNEEIITSLQKLEQEIYDLIGYEFKISSHEQLARELLRLGLDTKEYTDKKKTMKTGLRFLKRLEKQHPVVSKIMEYKKLSKLLNSFVSSLVESYREDLGGCRFAYHLTDAPTGRLASGNDEKNTYFGNLNIQAISKSSAVEYLAIPAHPQDPNAILGYSFLPLTKLEKDGETVLCTKTGRVVGKDITGILVEGQEQRNNVRRVFIPHKNHWFVHFDYKAQELRIPANLAQDQYMIDTFLSGRDPHEQVAILMFGAENYNKDKRKIAKILNFSTLYGASKYTIAERLGCSVDEAWEYMNTWWKIQSGLKRWKTHVENQGRQHGFVKTAFGRIRRVGYWFNKLNDQGNKDFRAEGFALRTCINTSVQGAAGDMMRKALVFLDKILLNEYPSSDIQILSSVHDEINFSIAKDRIAEVVPKIEKIMSDKLDTWPVNMEVDMEVGTSWGFMFPFKLENGVFQPNGKSVETTDDIQLEHREEDAILDEDDEDDED